MPTKEEYEARAAAALQRVEAAKKQQEEELAALMQEVAAKERRMAERALNKQALKTKRQADAWDPTPTPRPMADDHRLKMSARDPGPGAHSPRSECFRCAYTQTHTTSDLLSLLLTCINPSPTSHSTDFGTTFARSQFSPRAKYDKGAGSPDRWALNAAKDRPGPPTYNVKIKSRSNGFVPSGTAPTGTTFGLDPSLGRGKPKDAHDIMQTVEYLRDLPAPDMYSPDILEPIKVPCVKIMPTKELSTLERAMANSALVPGPGAYEEQEQLNKTTSSKMVPPSKKAVGQTELDKVMHWAAQLPGPGAHDHKTTLRSTGSPRIKNNYNTTKGSSMIEAIQAEAKLKPGPGAYHRTLTFAQELERDRYLRKVVKGEAPVGLSS